MVQIAGEPTESPVAILGIFVPEINSTFPRFLIIFLAGVKAWSFVILFIKILSS